MFVKDLIHSPSLLYHKPTSSTDMNIKILIMVPTNEQLNFMNLYSVVTVKMTKLLFSLSSYLF